MFDAFGIILDIIINQHRFGKNYEIDYHGKKVNFKTKEAENDKNE